MSKYYFDESEFYPRLYAISGIINTSKKWHTNVINGNSFGFIYHETQLVQEYLITLAVKFRIIDTFLFHKKRQFDLPIKVLGQIKSKNDTVDLTFRESCNKLIHADKIKFKTNKELESQYLTGEVELKGTHNGKSWECILDIESFCINGMSFCNQYINDWDACTWRDEEGDII